MLTGISVLGLLAGSLASFFRLDDQPDDAPPTPEPDGTDPALVHEVALLRAQVERLTERLGG